jgi:predicted kinase
MEKTLTLLRGVPGSGKSTFAKMITDDYSICEADQFFYDKEGSYNFDPARLKAAHEWCRFHVEARMKEDNPSIVVSNTFTKEWEMSDYFDLAKKYGYKVFTLIVENRHGGVNQHGVPEEKIKQMKDRFEIKL